MIQYTLTLASRRTGRPYARVPKSRAAVRKSAMWALVSPRKVRVFPELPATARGRMVIEKLLTAAKNIKEFDGLYRNAVLSGTRFVQYLSVVPVNLSNDMTYIGEPKSGTFVGVALSDRRSGRVYYLDGVEATPYSKRLFDAVNRSIADGAGEKVVLFLDTRRRLALRDQRALRRVVEFDAKGNMVRELTPEPIKIKKARAIAYTAPLYELKAGHYRKLRIEGETLDALTDRVVAYVNEQQMSERGLWSFEFQGVFTHESEKVKIAGAGGMGRSPEYFGWMLRSVLSDTLRSIGYRWTTLAKLAAIDPSYPNKTFAFTPDRLHPLAEKNFSDDEIAFRSAPWSRFTQIEQDTASFDLTVLLRYRRA